MSSYCEMDGFYVNTVTYARIIQIARTLASFMQEMAPQSWVFPAFKLVLICRLWQQ